MKIKYIKKHTKNCGSMKAFNKGTWNSPWAYPELIWKRTTAWVKFRCNSYECKAEAWVLNNELTMLIPASAK